MTDEDVQDKREAMKALRKERGDMIEIAQQRLKEQTRIRKEIARVLKVGPQTAPAVSAATGISTEVVFWHLMALRKYGQVVEAGEDGDYYRYQLSEK